MGVYVGVRLEVDVEVGGVGGEEIHGNSGLVV